jgi:hypothetical protein
MPFEDARGPLTDILDGICVIERFVAGLDLIAAVEASRG